MFDQINKYKASFGRLFEAKTLKVMLEIALLTILLSFLGPIKNMIYTEVVNKLSLGITVKLGIIMFASYIVVQVIEECVSYFQIYLNTVLQLKLGQSASHEINNKLAKVKLNSLEMYEIHDLVSRANQTIKSSIVSSLNLIIALYTPLATIDKPQERRKATGTGGIPPENIRLRRTLTTEYLQLSLCYGVRDRMSIETAGFTGWR